LAGFDAVLLANNHVLDYDVEALLEMLERLERAGTPYTGAGRNLQEASRPVVLHVRGLTVGLVAFTDNEPGWAATILAPGTNWIPVTLEERTLGPVRASVARAREAGAQLVIFSIHWGPNMVQRPSGLFRRFARAVIDAGADVFLGHSAHLFQGIEIYRDRPVIYDAGDFVDDYAVDPDVRNDRGLLFLLRVRHNPEGVEARPPGAGSAWVEAIDLLPVHIARCQVNLAGEQDARAIVAKMTTLCAEMGTRVAVRDGVMTIVCRGVPETRGAPRQR
ncbi:MAG TPA: CapA family protein, partial [Chloroflexia bacterium]|nr:CapA family protein [Chloroflexia bacterium]